MKKIILTLLAGFVLGVASFGAYVYVSAYKSGASHQLIPLIVVLSCLFLTIFALIWQRSKEEKHISLLAQEKQTSDAELKQMESLFENLFANDTSGVTILNLDGRITRVNKAFCELLGYSEEDILSMNLYYLIHPSDLNSLQIHIQQLIDKKIGVFQSEQQCVRKNGDTLWIMSTLSLIRDAYDKPLHFIMQAQNITLQKKAEERLRHMAYHDPLTGLANRNKMEQFINHMLATARRHQLSFAILFIDLDRFKNVNDTIGHEAGDLLLQIVAERLRSVVRSTDMVARLGGDEFVLLITDVIKTESVAVIANKILENVLKPIIIKGQEIYITTSIGMSLYPYDGQNMQTLMQNADLALYRAKENGRNNYQFYTAEMTNRAQKKLALQNALGHALVKDEFMLHYQPKMDVATRRITGVEALLRWKNKDYGMITPDEIISLAEETGLIIPVSDWIMRTAIAQLKKWHDMGFTSLSMAVNCSSRQFKQATFVDDILQILGQTGLPASTLEIELTESIIMKDPDNTLRVLYALKDLGVQIAIDDFGTGYWSHANLRKLSVDKIKIDKSFTKQVTVDETSAAITKSIIAMVTKLGIKAVAEGVETKEQYEFVVREGCTEIQGYYLTQPLSEDAMTVFLKHPVPDAEVISKGETIV